MLSKPPEPAFVASHKLLIPTFMTKKQLSTCANESSSGDVVSVFDRDTLGHVVDLVYTDESRCKLELFGMMVSCNL